MGTETICAPITSWLDIAMPSRRPTRRDSPRPTGENAAAAIYSHEAPTLHCFPIPADGMMPQRADAPRSCPSNQSRMNKPRIVEIPTSKRAKRPSGDVVQRGHEQATGLLMVGWKKRFRQLDWGDRLNLLLAGFLGLALVLALSPLLLVSWICLQLAERAAGFNRRASLKTKSPQL